MKAPEKIYVHVKKGKTLNIWNSEWIGVNDIEYTRTDALIEKACEWLEEHLLDFWSQRITNTDYFIEEFKKTMEE